MLFGREHGINVLTGIAAKGFIARVKTNILKIVEARLQANLGEHANLGDEDETDILGAALDNTVETAQIVALPTGKIGIIQHCQNWLVLLLVKDHDALTGLRGQTTQKIKKGFRTALILRPKQSKIPFDLLNYARIRILPSIFFNSLYLPSKFKRRTRCVTDQSQ
ncbi:MAG: hypothetical protein OXE94_11410 [Aestuariivita sp.]|nr:hypothetical protein [Aestuariivita sp.]MCY4201890.1 hypothetical protein [Aestuariivita sp.]